MKLINYCYNIQHTSDRLSLTIGTKKIEPIINGIIFFQAKNLKVLWALEGLSKLPVLWHNIVRLNCFLITSHDLKAQRLTEKLHASLPILPPISRHRIPTRLRPLNQNIGHLTGSCYVKNQNQIPVGIPLHIETDAALLHTRYAPELHWDNASMVVFDNLNKHRHGEVEMLAWWVAPSTVVAWFGPVGRAKISGCDLDGTRCTPLRAVVALQLEACTACLAIIEQSSAQCGCLQTVSLLE